MTNQKLLTIDFGTSGIKCMIFTSSGEVITHCFSPLQYQDTEGLSGIGKEFNAASEWKTIENMIRTCQKNAKGASKDVIAVAATSQRHGAVFLNRKGEVIYSGPNLDARGVFTQSSIMQELEISCPPTGCWPPLLYSLCRLLWFKQHKPDLYTQIHHVLSISDWIVYQLTGEATTDPSQASNTQFMNIQTSEWSSEILEMADIQRDLLPPILDPGSSLGCISPEISKRTGLSTKTIVGIGGADTQCALLGSAVIKPGEVCVVAGNTAPIQLITDKPLIDPECRLWTGRFMLPAHWVIEANMGKAGEVLRWFIQHIIVPLCPEIASNNNAAYAQTEKLAKKASVGSLGTLASLGPTIMNARDMTTVRPAMFLFPPPASPVVTPISIKELARALFENICYAARQNLELIQDLAEQKIKYCTVAGGLAQSQFWRQMLADVTGLEIQAGRVFEASSLGAGICAATAAELYDSLSLAVSEMVTKQPSLNPREEFQREYESYFIRWKTLYNQSANL